MTTEWYYAIDDVRHGPVSSQELRDLAKSGEVQPTDLVWKEGIAEWRPARHVKGLFPNELPTAKPLDQKTSTDVTESSSLTSERLISVATDATEHIKERMRQFFARKPSPKPPREDVDSSEVATRETIVTSPSPPITPVEDRNLHDLLRRLEQVMERAGDTSVPPDSVELERQEFLRQVQRHQSRLSDELVQLRVADADIPARILLGRQIDQSRGQARLARDGGRSDEADRLDAEADRLAVGYRPVAPEDRQANGDRRTRLKEEVELLRELAELIPGIADRLAARGGSTSPDRATPAVALQEADTSFSVWYARAFAPILSHPPAVAWGLQAAVWTFGCGFMWIPLLYLGGKANSCPKCGLLWVRQAQSEQVIQREQGYGTVTRTDEHYSGRGQYAGRTHRREQVVMNHDVVHLDYSCQQCGHRWSAQESRSYEA